MSDLLPIKPAQLQDPLEGRTLKDLVPEKLAKAIDRMPIGIMDLTQEELYKEEWRDHEDHFALCQRLRYAFWAEYDRAQAKNSRMVMQNVFAGQCTESTFYRIIGNPNRLAWILQPPENYLASMQELFELGTQEMRKILKMENSEDSKVMDVKFRIWQALDLRLRGAIIQRTENKNLNLNVNQDVPGGANGLTIEEIQAQLAALKNEAPALPPARSVTPGVIVDIPVGDKV